MTDQEKVNHYNVISEIRSTIGGWFGVADLIFAGIYQMKKESKKQENQL